MTIEKIFGAHSWEIAVYSPIAAVHKIANNREAPKSLVGGHKVVNHTELHENRHNKQNFHEKVNGCKVPVER